MKNRSYRLLGLLASVAVCASTQAAVVFQDTFDHPGGTVQAFLDAGWSAVYGTPGDNMGTGPSGNANATETVFWGNPTAGTGNTEAALEYQYKTAPVSCGDIITIQANCMRFEDKSYLQEISLWDGSNPASRVVVTNFNGVGHATGQYATWWTPPAKDAIAPLVYHAVSADAGKFVIFKYGHTSGWGETADVTFSIDSVTKPVFVTQPTALIRTAGESATLSVGVLGCGLTYQWKKDGVAVAGATTDTLTISPVAVANAGDYLCTVQNSFGTTNSAVAHLTVDPKLGGGASLALGINYGDEAPWNPTVTGTAYGLEPSRWQDTVPGSEAGPVNGTQSFLFGAGQIDVNWSAKNTYSTPGDPATLPPGNAQVNYGYLDDGDAGYFVQVNGLTTSVGFKEYVVRTVAASDNATSFADVTLTDNTLGTSQTLTYPVTVAANPGGGKASISTVSAPLTSDSISLASVRVGTTLTRGCLAGFIITDRPVILAQPVAPATVFTGGSFTLSAEAFGVQTLTYQWRKDGVNLPGATTATYTKSGAVEADSGSYDIVVNNAYGTATSAPAAVSVITVFKPTITQQPIARSAFLGSTTRFTVAADGGQLSYQWKKGGAAITGATTTTLTLAGISASDDADYTVTVSNPMGSTDSDAAHLTVVTSPAGYAGAILADHPVAFWRLGETGGTTAFDSIGGFDAPYTGGVVLGQPGAVAGDPSAGFVNTGWVVGNAPATVVDVPYAAALNPSGAFSVEFWAKPNSVPSDLFSPICSINPASGRSGYMFYLNGGSGWQFRLGNAAGVVANASGGTSSAGWQHVVGVYDGTAAYLYVNGTPYGPVTPSAAFAPNTAAVFRIGGTTLPNRAWDGLIDEVAVYNTALTAAQVRQHLFAGAPLRLGMAPVDNIVINAKPDAAPMHGQNLGAAWVASNTDGVKTRSGVMQFVAPEEDQLTVSGYSQLDSPNGTIAFWVRSGANAGTGNEAAIILDRRDTGGGGSGTVIAINDNGTVFFQANPTGANPFSSGGIINDDKWHHIAVVYQQKTGEPVTLYIDGALDNQSYNTKDWWWPAGLNVLLGKSRDTYWKKLNGYLDDVRFYNRTLSDTEINQIIATGAVVDAAALKLQFSFDTAPVSGYRMTTAPVPATVQVAPIVGAGYTDLGPTPYLFVPSAGMQFFRAWANQ